jgi:hypothetical protein
MVNKLRKALENRDAGYTLEVLIQINEGYLTIT